MIDPEERRLVQRAQRRESAAYGALVRRHERSVFNVCYRLLGNRQEAEDMTQEAFVRAYQRLETFDATRPFGPWIRQVAANLTLNRLRRRRPDTLPIDRPDLAVAAPEQDQPARRHEQREQAAALRDHIRQLPPHYRVVIELRHFQELSYAEIAEALELPINTVRSHLFRARKQLAERLKKDE